MNLWKIILKVPNDTGLEKELELYDAKSYFGGYLRIKRSYFNELTKTIKMTKNYSIGRAIEKVIGAENNEDWTLNPWMLLIVKDNEKKKSFLFFIKREKDLSGLLVAIGPKSYAEYNNNQNYSEARRGIKRIINYIIAYSNKFQCITLLPTYLP
jgi:hypothetical protein